MSKNYKNIEKLLYNYNRNNVDIKNMKLDLEILENDYREVGSISYEEKTSKTNAFSSPVENEIIKREWNIKNLKNEIRFKEINMMKLDNILASLNEKEMQFVKMKYFNRNTHAEISSTINMSFDYMNEYRLRILGIIASFFPEEL